VDPVLERVEDAVAHALSWCGLAGRWRRALRPLRVRASERRQALELVLRLSDLVVASCERVDDPNARKLVVRARMTHRSALAGLGRFRAAYRELDPLFASGEETLAAALHGVSRARGYGQTDRAAALLGLTIPIGGKPESEHTRRLVADILSGSNIGARLNRLIAGQNLRPPKRD
jgi:hypothetical protein